MTIPENDINRTNEDLGLGTRVIEENRSRFVNLDGSLNVHRKGMFTRGAWSPYHAILNMSWPRFYTYLFGIYAAAIFLFAGVYFLLGPHAFAETLSLGAARFGELLFYSAQIVTTLGSSAFQPVTALARILFAIEAMTGMIGFAVAAGLMFARFSNPAVHILWSARAVIGPYQGATAFMFRIVNGRSNELTEVSATVTIAMIETSGRRTFHQLSLERSTVLMFPLHWTVVHPITKESPIYGFGAADLDRVHAEFIVTITAVDRDLSKTVYDRHSYLYNEVIIGAKFGDIIERTADGTVVIDPARIHEVEDAALPASK